MAINLPRDPRDLILQQIGQNLGSGLGRAVEQKAMSGVAESLQQAGNSPESILQKMSIINPEFAQKNYEATLKAQAKEEEKLFVQDIGIQLVQAGKLPADFLEKAKTINDLAVGVKAYTALSPENQNIDTTTQTIMRGGQPHVVLFNADTGEEIRDLGTAKTPATGPTKPRQQLVFDPNTRESFFAQTNESGRLIDPGTGQPIDPRFLPAEESILKGAPREIAGTLANTALAQSVLPNIERVFQENFDQPGLGRTLNTISFGMGGLLDQDLRLASDQMGTLIETKVRIDSGAAIRDEEVDRLVRSFGPRVGDSYANIRIKLGMFRNWLTAIGPALDPTGRWSDLNAKQKGELITRSADAALSQIDDLIVSKNAAEPENKLTSKQIDQIKSTAPNLARRLGL